MPNSAVRVDGKGQYLGRSTVLDVYNVNIYNRGIYNFPSNLTIDDQWTLGFWTKPKSNKEHATIFAVGGKNGQNAIQVFSTAIPAETQVHGKRFAELRAIIKDSEGTTIKHFGWSDWFQTDVWIHTFLQWNGVELEAFRNAFVTTTGVAFVNDSGSMSDVPVRRVFYGSAIAGQFATFSGILGHLGMWDKILDPAELGTVVSGGFAMDLTTASGEYDSVANLQHYWKPGEDLTNLGKDFMVSGTRFNLDKPRNLTTDDVISDSP